MGWLQGILLCQSKLDSSISILYFLIFFFQMFVFKVNILRFAGFLVLWQQVLVSLSI